ncbi:MAG: TlyA family RNA methyltransferase [Chloroflexota bacterium]
MRLDLLLVERGLAPSRERARALILEGNVLLGGERHTKAGEMVATDSGLALAERQPFVSRGGLKLRQALRTFDVQPAGKVCLDVGASTGGFTDCLLQAGAARVYAVDVGYGQLDWNLRRDPRVVVLEKTNIRYLSELPETPRLATIDVSFISLSKVLPAVQRLLGGTATGPAGDLVALVKPQFEAGPGNAPKGVVRDPLVHRQVLSGVVAVARQGGWIPRGLVVSPVLGPAGNREFLLWLASQGEDAVGEEAISACTPR